MNLWIGGRDMKGVVNLVQMRRRLETTIASAQADLDAVNRLLQHEEASSIAAQGNAPSELKAMKPRGRRRRTNGQPTITERVVDSLHEGPLSTQEIVTRLRGQGMTTNGSAVRNIIRNLRQRHRVVQEGETATGFRYRLSEWVPGSQQEGKGGKEPGSPVKRRRRRASKKAKKP